MIILHRLEEFPFIKVVGVRVQFPSEACGPSQGLAGDRRADLRAHLIRASAGRK